MVLVVLRVPRRAIFGEYGLSGNDSLNFSGNGQIGGYVGSSGINLGLTGSFGFSAGTSRVLSSVMDINGDGVAELVWRDGSNLRGYNPGFNASSGGNIRLSGYGGPISKSSSSGMNLGGNININIPIGNWAFGSFTFQRNSNETKRMSMDVNGDGFLDVIWRYGSSFGRNDGRGNIVSTPWEGTGVIQEYREDYFTDDEAAEIEANHYPEHPVLRWRPWRSGRIGLSSLIAYETSADGSADGAEGQIYFGEVELPVLPPPPASDSTPTPDIELSINRAERPAVHSASSHEVSSDRALYFGEMSLQEQAEVYCVCFDDPRYYKAHHPKTGFNGIYNYFRVQEDEEAIPYFLTLLCRKRPEVCCGDGLGFLDAGIESSYCTGGFWLSGHSPSSVWCSVDSGVTQVRGRDGGWLVPPKRLEHSQRAD